MDRHELGRRLRAMRAASGRTVASVAAEAGLSVPYVANLENGRGNPTLDTLSRIAAALGTAVHLEFADGNGTGGTGVTGPGAALPANLVRLGRDARFRRVVALLAEAGGQRPTTVAARLLDLLAGLVALTGREPGDADCFRLLDALLLTALNPES